MRSDSATVSASNVVAFWNLRPTPNATHSYGGLRSISWSLMSTRARGTLAAVADTAHERGLAGAVRPDQAEQLAAPRVEVDAVEHQQAAEMLAHAFERDGMLAAGRQSGERLFDGGPQLGHLGARFGPSAAREQPLDQRRDALR